MKYFWKLPPEPEDLPTPNFSLAGIIVCSLLAGAFVLIFNAVMLDENALKMDILLWRLLVFPLLFALIGFTVAMVGYCITQYCEAQTRESYKLNRQRWQRNASVCLRLAEHHSLFPVENAALKMIGLEGEMPAAKDIPRKLNIDEDEEAGVSRTQQTIKMLLEGLDTSAIDERFDQPEVWLYLRNASDRLSEDAGEIVRQSRPAFSQSTIHLLSVLPERAFLEEWTLEYFEGFRLLIVAELHHDNDHDFCEYATALLFSRQRPLPDSRMPVWCFRSLDSKQHTVGKYLKILFAAEQIRPADLRHVWTGNLQGESLNLLSDAFTEVDTGVKSHQWHSMRLAETWTPGYQWLMLEWSARAIRNGQHGQLLATKQENSQQINLALINGEYLPHEIDNLDQEGCMGTSFQFMGYWLFFLNIQGVFLFFSLQNGWALDAEFSVWWLVSGMFVILLAIIGLVTSGIYIDSCHQRSIDRYYEYE
ncbi:hypothetical protein NG99_25990 [Erwinia typographi]|uniref:Uncharacterized protein n=1 Tax=Erwinia typographi TaxID=371042 RepID=A0A0A3YHU0_9GAMM|nr:hypothetical protein NG99_25990 [Erwinia typographi]